MRSRAKVRRRRRPQMTDMRRVLHQLASHYEHPARLLELYYWSREPKLAEIMRQIIAMPDEAIATLHAFFKLAEGDPNPVTVSVNVNGDVTLSSSTVEGLLTMMEASAKEKTAQPLH